VPDVTTRSFRKTLATLIDEGGMSARVGADHPHRRVADRNPRFGSLCMNMTPTEKRIGGGSSPCGSGAGWAGAVDRRCGCAAG
jgi:hypothetical protein